jgi:hypothetical protein
VERRSEQATNGRVEEEVGARELLREERRRRAGLETGTGINLNEGKEERLLAAAREKERQRYNERGRKRGVEEAAARGGVVVVAVVGWWWRC